MRARQGLLQPDADTIRGRAHDNLCVNLSPCTRADRLRRCKVYKCATAHPCPNPLTLRRPRPGASTAAMSGSQTSPPAFLVAYPSPAVLVRRPTKTSPCIILPPPQYPILPAASIRCPVHQVPKNKLRRLRRHSVARQISIISTVTPAPCSPSFNVILLSAPRRSASNDRQGAR